MAVYLVGGAVRDELMGKPGRDRDFVVIGQTSERFAADHPRAVRVGKQDEHTYIVRGEEYTISSSPDIESDLATRDLTINALARDESGRMVAHPKALADIESKILRPVAEGNFLRDPHRVFRAARFHAALPEFSLAPELPELMRSIAAKGLLAGIAAERVGQETLKACATERPGNYLRLLDSTGCLDPWLAEFSGSSGIPAGPPEHHDSSVLEHTARVMDRAAGDQLTVWMALAHDLGKAATGADLLPRHHGHDRAGREPAEALARRLKLPNAFIRAGGMAARLHMVMGKYKELRPGTRVDLLTELDAAGLTRQMAALVLADTDLDLSLPAARDLARIKSVRLPPDERDLGPESGERLRELRCRALSRP